MIHLKLYGVFRSAAQTDAVNVSVPDATPTVRSAINELVSRPGCEELRKLIFEESEDPRSNALILLAGQEIGALAGLDTTLKEDDELSLLPIAHGG
jgi:molybdopterin converting factor small subunit